MADSVQLAEKLIALAASTNEHEAAQAAVRACAIIRRNGYRIVDAATEHAAPVQHAEAPNAGGGSFFDVLFRAIHQGVFPGSSAASAAAATLVHDEDLEHAEGARVGWWIVDERDRYIEEHTRKRDAWPRAVRLVRASGRRRSIWRMDPSSATLESEETGRPLRVAELVARFEPQTT